MFIADQLPDSRSIIDEVVWYLEERRGRVTLFYHRSIPPTLTTLFFFFTCRQFISRCAYFCLFCLLVFCHGWTQYEQYLAKKVCVFEQIWRPICGYCLKGATPPIVQFGHTVVSNRSGRSIHVFHLKWKYKCEWKWSEVKILDSKYYQI